jgi:hypothetical protein
MTTSSDLHKELDGMLGLDVQREKLTLAPSAASLFSKAKLDRRRTSLESKAAHDKDLGFRRLEYSMDSRMSIYTCR